MRGCLSSFRSGRDGLYQTNKRLCFFLIVKLCLELFKPVFEVDFAFSCVIIRTSKREIINLKACWFMFWHEIHFIRECL